VKPVREHAKDSHLPIFGKEYFELKRIAQVLAAIQRVPDEEGTRFIYQRSHRFNENDGVIFVCDTEPLAAGLRPRLKKWKWPELQTVRFHLQPANDADSRRYEASYVGADERSLVRYRALLLLPEDAAKVERHLKLHDQREGVFEFYYEVEVGDWRPLRPRFDLRASKIENILVELEQTANAITLATVSLAFDERVRREAHLAPSTPDAPSPASQPLSRGRSPIAPKPTSTRTSPALAAPMSLPKAPPRLTREDTDEVMQTPTPSPPNLAPTQGVKRARDESRLSPVESQATKRPRTE